LYGSAEQVIFSKDQKLLDDVVLKIGGGGDLRLRHSSGNNSGYIQNYTGDLYIENLADDKDIIFKSDDGDGGTATYFYLDGSAAVSGGARSIIHLDNVKSKWGTGGDFVLYHDGTDSYITNNTGDVIIQNSTDDKDVILKSDDGSGGTTPYITLDGSVGYTKASKAIQMADGNAFYAGSSNDLGIYHDGSNSYISQTVTGNLVIQNTTDDADIILKSDDGSGGTTAYITLDGGDVSTVINTIKVLMPSLPTSDPVAEGQLWQDEGTVKISAGG